jgi:hypothetical protein
LAEQIVLIGSWMTFALAVLPTRIELSSWNPTTLAVVPSPYDRDVAHLVSVLPVGGECPWPASAAGVTSRAKLYLGLFGAVSATGVHS